jgi:hypothetical protein
MLGPTRSTLCFLMCPACLAAHPAHQVLEGIRIEDIIERRDLDDAMDESAANLPGHVAACGMCVDEALIAGARVRGEPDPFTVYERSLWPIHRAALEELREHLMVHFASLQTTRPSSVAWFDVSPGSLREPTLTSVHGLLDHDAQSRVVGAVPTFLAGRERDQARVVFFEVRWVDGAMAAALLRVETTGCLSTREQSSTT